MTAFDWSPHHKYFATAGPGRHVLLDHHDIMKPIKVLDGHSDVVCDVSFAEHVINWSQFLLIR